MASATYRRSNSKRRRRTAEERQALELESLQRARSNPSWANFGQVIEAFAARGIPAAEISPKENVLTYNAWRALGRQVRRGETSVKITVWHPIEGKERDISTGEEKTTTRTRAVTSCVFHISQTDPIGAPTSAPSSSAAAAEVTSAAPSSVPAPDHIALAIEYARRECYGRPTAQQVYGCAARYFDNSSAARAQFASCEAFAKQAQAQFESSSSAAAPTSAIVVGPLIRAEFCAACGATCPNTWSDPRGYIQVAGKTYCGAACHAAAADDTERHADDCECGRPLNEFAQCSSADSGAPCRALLGILGN